MYNILHLNKNIMKKLLLNFILLVGVSLSAQENVVSETEIIYKVIDDIELKMNVFVPSEQAASRGAIILFHGGGWNNGKPIAFRRHAKFFSDLGLVIFTPTYRLRDVNNTTIVEAVEDAKSAVAWVKSHADEYNINLDKLAVGGGSAGGHLAIATVTLDGVGEQSPKQDYRPSALVLFNPVLDVSPDGYGNYKIKKEIVPYGLVWQQLSPMEHITEGMPPTIVMVGDRDGVLKKHIALKFEERMLEKNNDFALKLYPNAEHTFYQYGYPTLKRFDYPEGTKNRYYYEVLQDTEDFLVEHGYLEKRARIKIPEDAIYPVRTEELSNSSFKKHKFSLYPNPTSNHIKIIGNFDKETRVIVYQLDGRECMVKNINKTEKYLLLDVSSLVEGTYIVSVDGKSYSMMKK